MKKFSKPQSYNFWIYFMISWFGYAGLTCLWSKDEDIKNTNQSPLSSMICVHMSQIAATVNFKGTNYAGFITNIFTHTCLD